MSYDENLQEKLDQLERELAEAKSLILSLSQQTKSQVDNTIECESTLSHAAKISALKQTEETLRRSEQMFSHVFQSNPAGLAIARVADTSITDVNASFCEIVGYERDLIVENAALNLNFFTKAADEDIFLLFERHGKVHNLEFNVLTRSRTTRRVIFSLHPIDADGEPCMLATMIDITERKQAEDALAESERRQREISRLLELDQARLAAVLRHLPVGVRIVDQNIRLVGNNELADWTCGSESSLNSVTESNAVAAWLQESGKKLKPEEYPLAAAVQTGKPMEPVELVVRRPDGSIGTMLVSATPIKDRQGLITGAVGVNVDITSRKQAEDALRKSEELFAKAFHTNPDAVIISQLSDGLILAVNEGWTKISGYSQSETIGRTTLALGIYVDPDDRNKIINKLKENGSLRNFELQIRRQSGEVRQGSMSSERIEIDNVDCLLTTIHDITEHKAAEQALRRSAWRLNRGEEIAHLGSWELDLINNQLTWSDEVYRIFGLQPQEFGATYEAFIQAVHPEDRSQVDAAYSNSIRDGKDYYEIEHRVIKRSNGEIRIVHEKCEHFRNEGGQIIRSVGMVHDVTEQKQAEAKLKEYAERLHSSKCATQK